MGNQADLLVDFLNSLDIEHGTDSFDRPRNYAAWCRSRGLRPGSWQEARSLREALRAMLSGEPAALPALAVRVSPAPGGGVELAPTNLVQAVLAAATALTLAGDWGRLKLCPADDCRWAFYDHSRNRSRVWCDMADCGNLAKVRGFRARTGR